MNKKLTATLQTDQGDHLVAEPKPGHFLKTIPYLRNMLGNIKFTVHAICLQWATMYCADFFTSKTR